MPKLNYLLLILIVLIVIPLYPKFPLLGVGGTFVAVRLEDFVLLGIFILWGVYQLANQLPIFKEPVSRSIFWYLGIGFVGVFTGVVLTKSIDLNQGLLHGFRRVEYMLMFPVAYSFLTKLSDLKFITRTILLVSALVGLYGLGQQFLNFPVITTSNSEFSKGLAITLGPGARINSTFAGHYDLAAYSILPLLLILGLLVTTSKHRIWLVGLALPIYWAMLLSASRVAFAALFLVAILLVIILRKYLLIGPLLVLAAASILASPQLAGRYGELIINHLKISFVAPVYAAAVDEVVPDALKPPIVPEDRSLNIRLQAEWPRAIRAFLKNPFLGSGFSSIGLAADNDYLRLLAETGLLGFLAFAGIIYRIGKTTWPYLTSPPTDFPGLFIVCITCFLLGILLNAVFIDVFEASKIGIITWTALGLAQKAKELS